MLFQSGQLNKEIIFEDKVWETKQSLGLFKIEKKRRLYYMIDDLKVYSSCVSWKYNEKQVEMIINNGELRRYGLAY